MMTRKHFAVIAATLAATKPQTGAGDALFLWERLTLQMAHTLSGENPAFDKPRFLAACGFVLEKGES